MNEKELLELISKGLLVLNETEMLNMIREKMLDIYDIDDCTSAEDYNSRYMGCDTDGKFTLTRAEFYLLKIWLGKRL